MLSISNLLLEHESGNESLRYGHQRRTAIDGAPRPVVVWAVTQACNLSCVHCYANATPGPAHGELDFKEGLNLLDDLRGFGVPAVLFSGGEPLVRQDLLGLMSYAQTLGLPTTLSTNGVLIDDATADELARVGLKYAGISIDGKEEQHDRLRGQRGAFAATTAGIDRCRSRGIKVGLRFTVTALNEAALESIFEMCVEHDVARLCVYHLAYSGRGGKMAKVDLDAAGTRRVVDRIFELTRSMHDRGHELEVLTVGNHADAAYLLSYLETADPLRAERAKTLLRGTGGNRSGSNIAAIDPIGNVHYDQFSWHYNCGNVRETPFSRIWSEARDPRLAMLRDRKTHLPQRCRDCRFLDVCNGNLRTRAEAATGDWMGNDPACYLTDAEIASPAVLV